MAGIGKDTRICVMFQSRNRGSFDFKGHPHRDLFRPSQGFNLVIEVLLISSEYIEEALISDVKFQSRNRGSFDFKSRKLSNNGFNTFWFQSRNRGSFDFKFTESRRYKEFNTRFNLVIEVLLISRQVEVDKEDENSNSVSIS